MLTALFKTTSFLPLRLNYATSRGVAWLMHRVVRYRRNVILDNLRSSFPEKPEKEIRRICRDFYRFLCDYFMETVAMASMPPEEMKRRMRFENMQAVNDTLRSGRPVSLFLGHYCNWEWCSSIPLHLDARSKAMQVYHPLENKDADKAFLMLRSRYGATSVAMDDTLRAIVGCRRDGIPSIMGYIADQGPLLENIHLFVDFLNHDTPVLTGAEKISRKIGAAAFYCDMRRESRGHYVCRMVELTPDASQEPPFELTRRYWQLLEQSIRRQPELWLWSHRRWKRDRADFIRAYGEAEAARRLSHL